MKLEGQLICDVKQHIGCVVAAVIVNVVVPPDDPIAGVCNSYETEGWRVLNIQPTPDDATVITLVKRTTQPTQPQIIPVTAVPRGVKNVIH